MVWYSSTLGDFLCGVPVVAVHAREQLPQSTLALIQIDVCRSLLPSRRRLKTFSRHASPALQRLDPYRCERVDREERGKRNGRPGPQLTLKKISLFSCDAFSVQDDQI